MLYLLRQFRRKQLKENKVATYLLYGVGEIILVVIGILIAVNIDDWNKKKENRILEIKYLKELKSNLEFDLKDIAFNIEFNESRKKSNEIIIHQLRSDIPYHDSLAFHFSNLVFSTRTLPKKSAFESLRSKGLEIISNDSLRSELTLIYSVSYHDAIDFETKDDHPFQFQVLWPEVLKVIEIDSLGKAARPVNYPRLKNNITFKNALTANLTIRKYMIDKYYALELKVANLIQLIDKELLKLQSQ